MLINLFAALTVKAGMLPDSRKSIDFKHKYPEMTNLSRRSFLKTGAIAAAGISLTERPLFSPDEAEKIVRVGVIGIGKRGSRHLNTLLSVDGVEITAVCDILDGNTAKAAKMCEDAGRKIPAVYNGNVTVYKEMLDKEKLDAVIVATYWDSHSAIALHAMQNGVYAGTEAPAALTIEDTWRLVESSEKNGVQCMMLENMSFRKDNLTILKMQRLGLFGDVVHCEGEFSEEWVDYWFFDSKNGEPNWAVDYLKKYNRDQFPGPSIGPLLGWLDINRGDIITEIYSTAAESKVINAFFKREFGADFPQGKMKYTQGDLVTSVMKTSQGKTLVINTSLQLPVPDSKSWKLEGTMGVYDKDKNSVHLSSKTPGYHRWESFDPYKLKYNHIWWETDYSNKFNEGADFVMLNQFIKAVRAKVTTPFDVYDSAVMSAIVELSGISIEKGAPVPFPDFTRGKWQTNKICFGAE